MSAPAASVPLTSIAPRPVDVAAIERELHRLWHEPGSKGVATRTCMSNLIVWCPTAEQARGLTDEVGQIVYHHPARVLLLIGESPRGNEPIHANVSAFCTMAGNGRHICSEHVTLSAVPEAVRRLPSVVRSLLIGDLPTSLWWASIEPPALSGELLSELARMSDQVIYESQGWRDPVRDMIATVEWAAGEASHRLIADLEWRRLKTWRRLISQALDPAVVPGALEAITEVRFEHGPHALAKTWMLCGWLASKLGWQPEGGKVAPGVEVTWKFRSPKGQVRITIHRLSTGEPKVQAGSVTWKLDGKTDSINIIRLGPGRLGLRGNDPNAPPRLQVVPSQSRAELIAKQLPDLARDDLFRETLQISRVMAQALLH
jgi:glucose-6-phosphate dehydrogenase assembly protein OpcA